MANSHAWPPKHKPGDRLNEQEHRSSCDDVASNPSCEQAQVELMNLCGKAVALRFVQNRSFEGIEGHRAAPSLVRQVCSPGHVLTI